MLEENKSTQNNNHESLLTLKQLSEWLQIKPSTIYKWTHFGYIPHIKLGKSVRFERIQVERWYRRRQRKGRAQIRLTENESDEKLWDQIGTKQDE